MKKKLLRIGRGPVTQFAMLSFFVTATTTAALVVVISYHFRQDLLEREWTLTAAYVKKEAQKILVRSDFETPNDPASQARFDQFYQDVILMPELVRLKIYDTEMRVIWSDEPRLIGQRFPDNPELKGALGGHVSVKAEIGERKGDAIAEHRRLGVGERDVGHTQQARRRRRRDPRHRQYHVGPEASDPPSETRPALGELHARPPAALLPRQAHVRKTEQLQEAMRDVLVARHDLHRIAPRLPAADQRPEEVHVFRMVDVEQDTHSHARHLLTAEARRRRDEQGGLR